MQIEPIMKTVNGGMVAFDLALATGAFFAPEKTLEVLIGHDSPSQDAKALFQRCAPIWVTFAAGHLVAAKRGNAEDWWAVAWLRATEIATDVVWSQTAAFQGKKARIGALWFAGAFNLALTLGAGFMARQPVEKSKKPLSKRFCCRLRSRK